MKQFDVWNVELNTTRGPEIKKTRPCMIVSPDSINRTINTVIVAPLTHTRKGYPSRINCEFKNESGQIILDQIRAVDKSRLVKKLGKMDVATCRDVCTILQVMFQFPS